MDKQEIEKAINAMGITLKAEFVPFSFSRNRNETYPSLNWTVKILFKGNEIVQTSYSAGYGHAPSYKGFKISQDVISECESGKSRIGPGVKILPKITDVIHSLVTECDVLGLESFEQWAGEYGYDPDSRKAEKIYQDCRIQSMKFIAIGKDNLEKLRELFEDY